MTELITSKITALQEHSHALDCSATLIPQPRRAVITANKCAVEALRETLPYAGDDFNAEALLTRHLADIGHDLEDCAEAIKTLRKKSPTQFFEIETLRERLLDQQHSEKRIRWDKRGAAKLTPAQQRTLNAMREEARQDKRDAAELAETREA
ncbi:MAG: hypothetical protein ABJN69_07915 [Hellea sp.]